MSMWSWLYPDRRDTVTPLIDVDERGTGPSPCCAHLEQRLREVDEARATYFAQACDLAEKLAEAEACIAELTAALDRDRPAPDREALGRDLERAWWAQRDGTLAREAWAQVADVAIDTCRGLRTTTERPDDPADTAKVGDSLGMAWVDGQGYPCAARHQQVMCTRSAGHSGKHVATASGDVVAVWPADAPVTAPGGLRWGTWGKAAEVLREIGTDIDLGAPVGAMAASMLRALATDLDTLHQRPDQRPVIAAVLTAHELLADGTCRCGWAGSELWHAEHVAGQIVGTGAVAP
jgi:hypothetical protein